MRFLCEFDEAARDFFNGDHESLRQAIIFRGLRPLVEVRGTAVADDFSEDELPSSGQTPYARWHHRRNGKAELSGWFYVDVEDAVKWVRDRRSIQGWSHLWLAPDSGVPWVGDFMLEVPSNGPLWFLLSDLKEIAGPMELIAAEVPASTPAETNEQKPLGTRERNNLLRVLAGLAVEAKIDLRSEKATVQIAEAGRKFEGPDEKTVRKWLAQIRATVIEARSSDQQAR